jgi:hypothetical protein
MQTNLPKMSKRAELALEVLANGGRFVNRLERNSYTGREQFHMRLCSSQAWHSVVSGIGHATFCELDKLGFLVPDYGTGSSVSEPYKLNKEFA